MERVTLILAVFLLGSTLPAYSEQPIDVLRNTVDKGIRVLVNPRYKDADQKEAQYQRLCQIAETAIDFDEFSRLVLGRNYRRFTTRQYSEFMRLFKQFLYRFFLSRLQEKYTDEKVIFTGQELNSDYRARVTAKVLWQDLEIPVEVRMLNLNGAWKVYNISVFDFSAVLFYRVQFEALLIRKSPLQVIDLLKGKIAVEEKHMDLETRQRQALPGRQK